MGMVKKANELAETHGWFLTRQFENEANADMHSRTTAREIIDDFEGDAARLLGHRLRHRRHAEGRRARAGARSGRRPRSSSASPRTRRCSSSGEPQQRNPDGSPAAPHPAFKPHPMQGWTPDFIPKLTGDAVDMQRASTASCAIAGPGRDALQQGPGDRRKASSSASPPAPPSPAPCRSCAEAPKGANILAMLPDTGERYLSTPLFADMPADMTEEEIAISQSTPSAQMPPPA